MNWRGAVDGEEREAVYGWNGRGLLSANSRLVFDVNKVPDVCLESDER